MSFQSNTAIFIGLYVIAVFLSSLKAQDWPQWRGTGRDAKVTGFKR